MHPQMVFRWPCQGETEGQYGEQEVRVKVGEQASRGVEGELEGVEDQLAVLIRWVILVAEGAGVLYYYLKW